MLYVMAGVKGRIELGVREHKRGGRLAEAQA